MFLNLDSCDEKHQTRSSLRSRKRDLGGFEFLLKYHTSSRFRSPPLPGSPPLSCRAGYAEVTQGQSFAEIYSFISRKAGREAGVTLNLSWFIVDGLTAIYLGCHTSPFRWGYLHSSGCTIFHRVLSAVRKKTPKENLVLSSQNKRSSGYVCTGCSFKGHQQL